VEWMEEERERWKEAEEDVSFDVEESGRGMSLVGIGVSGKGSRYSSFMSMFQILTVWSAEQVARSLMSGERRRRVR
jgi:hypothetical protein